MSSRESGMVMLRLGTAGDDTKDVYVISEGAIKRALGVNNISRVYSPDIQSVMYTSTAKLPVVVRIDEDWAGAYNMMVTDAETGLTAFVILPPSPALCDIQIMSQCNKNKLDKHRLLHTTDKWFVGESLKPNGENTLKVPKDSPIISYLSQPALPDETDPNYMVVSADVAEKAVAACLLDGDAVDLSQGIKVWTHAIGAEKGVNGLGAPIYLYLQISATFLPTPTTTKSESETDSREDADSTPVSDTTTTHSSHVEQVSGSDLSDGKITPVRQEQHDHATPDPMVTLPPNTPATIGPNVVHVPMPLHSSPLLSRWDVTGMRSDSDEGAQILHNNYMEQNVVGTQITHSNHTDQNDGPFDM